MKCLICGVKKLSNPMFIVFTVSKLLVGVGIGVLFATDLVPYAWWFLGTGIVLSIICAVLAYKKVDEK